MLLESENPFSTGGGDTPKKTAGQQKERRAINSVVAAICGKTSGVWGRLYARLPSIVMKPLSVVAELLAITPLISDGILEEKPLGIIKLIGPRGTGKTTLLNYAHQQAKKKGVHVVRLGLLEDIDQESSALSFLIDELKAPWWNIIVNVLEFRLDFFKLTTTRRKVRYEKLLRSRLASKPVLFLLDDAQLYQHKALRMMIRSTQQLLGQGYRVGMILTGSPQLTEHLMNIEVPSINRGYSIYVNTLGHEDACEALFGPFQAFKLSEKAKDDLYWLAACYPYFIQITGFIAWSTLAEEKAEELDIGLMAKIAKLVNEEKFWFFLSMYELLDKDDLIPAASAMTEILYIHNNAIPKSQMVAAVEEACQMKRPEVWEFIERLLDLGILSVNKERKLEAGIPGFLYYLDEKYDQLTPAKDEELENPEA